MAWILNQLARNLLKSRCRRHIAWWGVLVLSAAMASGIVGRVQEVSFTNETGTVIDAKFRD